MPRDLDEYGINTDMGLYKAEGDSLSDIMAADAADEARRRKALRRLPTGSRRLREETARRARELGWTGTPRHVPGSSLENTVDDLIHALKTTTPDEVSELLEQASEATDWREAQEAREAAAKAHARRRTARTSLSVQSTPDYWENPMRPPDEAKAWAKKQAKRVRQRRALSGMRGLGGKALGVGGLLLALPEIADAVERKSAGGTVGDLLGDLAMTGMGLPQLDEWEQASRKYRTVGGVQPPRVMD